MDVNRLIETLKEHEGLMLKPYVDSVGILSIGYGRNLEAVGISEEEAEMLLKSDLETAIEETLKIFPDLRESHDDVRQEVMVNMVFNLGSFRFRKFKKTIAAFNQKNYKKTATEMEDSKWYTQVGRRAKQLVYAMQYGKFPES